MAPKRKLSLTPSPSPAPLLSPRTTRSSSAAAAAAAAAPPAKKPRKAAEGKQKGKVKEPDAPAPASAAAAGSDSAKTIIVEACKQCHQFKKRAMMVKDGLESGVPGVTVIVNPQKPRRGCFEVREANGGTFVSLLDMKRPFKPMRELDMDALISDIIKKIE